MVDPSDSVEDIRRLDPIDGEGLAAAWSQSNAHRALFEEITTMPIDTLTRSETPAPVSAPAPRRVFKLAFAVAAVAVALVVAQGLLFSGAPAYAVRPLPNGVLEITVSPQMRDGNALAAELREYGVDVEVTTIPSSPGMVGQVQIFGPGGGDYIPTGLTFGADGSPDVFNWTIDPNLFTERLTVEINVAAAPGEPYVSSQEVFEPGEVLGGLHCALGVPLRAAEVAPYLADLGVTPVWFTIYPTGDPSITDSVEVFDVPDGQILHGHALDATTVQFNVVVDGVTLDEMYTPYISDVPCTPEQAAAWR